MKCPKFCIPFFKKWSMSVVAVHDLSILVHFTLCVSQTIDDDLYGDIKVLFTTGLLVCVCILNCIIISNPPLHAWKSLYPDPSFHLCGYPCLVCVCSVDLLLCMHLGFRWGKALRQWLVGPFSIANCLQKERILQCFISVADVDFLLVHKCCKKGVTAFR